MSLIICVVSWGREKGKTKLIEQLTERFAGEGFRVVTVKHIHGSFDTAEKDTWRHLDAGASLTIASTPTEVITIRRCVNPFLEKALEAVYVKPELVLVEGYKDSSIPKIFCAETASDVETMVKEASNIVMVSGPIAGKAREMDSVRKRFPEMGIYNFEGLVAALKGMLAEKILEELPGLNCGHCEFGTCLGLARAILRREATIEKCEVLATTIVALKVNGKTVPLSRFPQEALRGVVLGLLGSLKGVVKQPKDVELKIKV